MKVTIEIPKSFDGYFSEIDIPNEFKLNNALILYKQGKISISRASELAGLDIYEFMYECKKNEIPIIDYSENDFKDELKNLK